MDYLSGKKKKKPNLPKYRDPQTQEMFEQGVGSSGKGRHHNRSKDVAKGRSRKQKHKKRNEHFAESQPLMMRRDYGASEHMGADFLAEEMEARFKEGPEGRRQWESWMEEQDEDFQSEWKSNTEKHRDKFKRMARRVASAYQSESYMSLQNIRGLQEAIMDISEMVNDEDELEGWVEDKLSRAHQILSDLRNYFLFRGYHENEEDSDDGLS